MKRTLALLLCLAMLLSYLPGTLFSASADDAVTPDDNDIAVEITPDDEVVETTTSDASESTPAVHTAYCAACDDNVVWTAVTSGTQISSANDTHFYLSENCTYAGSLPVISVEAGTVCVDLNGHTLTTATEINVKGELNIQGEGSVIGNSNKTDIDFDDLINAGQGGETVAYNTALFNIAAADAAVNIYGGTYSVINDMPIVAYTEAGSLNLLGGEIAGTVSGDNLTLGGAAKVTLIETANLTVKADWTGAAVVNATVLKNGVAGGDFTGSLKTPQGRKVINDNGTLKVSVLENNPVQEAALDMVFPTDGSDYVAVCPACNEEVVWKAVMDGNAIRRSGGTHRYMAEDSTVNGTSSFLSHWSSNQDDVLCLHLNGKTINTSGYIDASKSTLNIMGNGFVNCNGAAGENGIAAINVTHSGADTHLYGGTYIASGDAAYSLNFKAAGTVTSYEGVTFVGNVNAPVGEMFIEDGTVYGVQGENITWTFEDGVLSVSGTGAMDSDEEGKNVSWYGVNCSVKTFYIGAGINSIGDSALSGTTQLEAINVAEGNELFASEDGILYSKAMNTLLMIPGALADEINIPATVTLIAPDAFYNTTNVTAINVDSANENYSSVDGILFNKDQSNLIRFPAKKAGTYNIPETVTSVAAYAFAYCEELTAVTVPDSVTELGENSFRDAIALESLVLSKNLTVIPANMCYGCESLIKATVPEGVTAIGDYAYAGTMVAVATIPATVTEIGAGAFRFAPLTDVYYGSTEEAWNLIAYVPVDAAGVVDELEAATIHYLTGITVTAPTKDEYELGEELDLEGLVVTGTYSDETTATITEGYEVTGFDSETAGVKTITVTYGEFTATFEVTVKEAAPEVVITGIEVTTLPTKVSYYVGDTFSSKGMVVTATYSDGSTAEITDYTVVVDLSTAGTQTVTVTSGEFSDTFTVEVLPLAEIEITATNASKNITVSWTNVSATSYVLYERHLVDGVMTEWTKLTTVTSTRYSHTTVTEGVTYEYKVEAKSGSKIIGEAVSAPITRLVAFTITSVVNDAEGALITWDAFANAQAYSIYRADYVDGAYGEFALIAEITEWDAEATELTYTDLNVAHGLKYRYMIRVTCNGALSPAATGTDFMRIEATTVTVSNTKSGQKLQWVNSGISGGAYYIWESYQNSDGTWTEETRYKIANNPYTFGGRVNGRMYRYRIAYYNGTYVAPSSDYVEMMYISTVYPIAVNERNAIKLTWDANAVADKYYLYKSWKVDGVWTEYGRAIETLTTLSYTDTDVENGVEYRYALRPAKDHNGVQYISGYRDGTIITRVDGQNFTVTNASAGLSVSYQENSKATRFYIYIFPVQDNGSLGEGTRISVLPASYPNKYNLLASNYGLEPGKAYCIKVVSVISTTVGIGVTSDPFIYIPTTAYTNATATTTKITVSWKKVAGAALFEVNRRVVDTETGVVSDWEVVGTTTPDVNSFVDTTAEKGVTYQYIVYGVNGTSYSLGKESANITLK